MGTRVRQFTLPGIPLALAAVAVAGLSAEWVSAADKPMLGDPTQFEVEITETEKGFDFKGWALTEHPAKLIVRNKNHVTHGFTSPLFNMIPVRMEGQGVEVQGKHFKSFHLEPGKTMTLYFTAPAKKHPETGQPEHQYYMVWCDIHPQAKGELHIVETTGEIGGG